MATVIERKFKVDCEFDDIPSTYDRADKIAGIKLDRRKKYAIINGEVCESASWTRPCSGCSCANEYPCDCCIERGAGCHECGYTGKRIESHWIPIHS